MGFGVVSVWVQWVVGRLGRMGRLGSNFRVTHVKNLIAGFGAGLGLSLYMCWKHPPQAPHLPQLVCIPLFELCFPHLPL